jgi:hypothetical protein
LFGLGGFGTWHAIFGLKMAKEKYRQKQGQ